MKQAEITQLETYMLQQLTTGVYKMVCEDLGYSNQSLREAALLGHKMNHVDYTKATNKLDLEYCKAICRLDSHLLNLILKAHGQNRIRRAQRTLDAICNELLERELHEEEAEEVE